LDLDLPVQSVHVTTEFVWLEIKQNDSTHNK